MSTSITLSITVEDAVARMVNLDYIPTGFTLMDMTAAFLEDAEVDHHNAHFDLLPDNQIAALETRIDVCKARHSLAKSLLGAIKNEIKNPEGIIETIDNNSGVDQHITFDSFITWASSYGIGIPDLSPSSMPSNSERSISWEDVNIKIYVDYRIAYFSEATGPKGITKSFREIGLMGNRKNIPNKLGGILVGLSKGEKFPSGKKLLGMHATSISKLRASLKQLTELTSDPFCIFNEADGYRPRFKLIDDRKNADVRSKNRATHVSRDDPNYHETENKDSLNFDEESEIESYEFHEPDVGETMADADADAAANDFLAKHRR